MQKERVQIKEILPAQDNYTKINRYLLALLHLDSAMNNMLTLMCEEFKLQGIYRMGIKNECQKIRKMLKTNPKNNWNTLSQEAIDDFCDDADKFEEMLQRFFGIEQGFNMVFQPAFSIGQKVWTTDNEGQARLAVVKELKIDINKNSDGLIDNSYYILEELNNSTNKPLNRPFLHRGEKEIYKTRKSYDKERIN